MSGVKVHLCVIYGKTRRNLECLTHTHTHTHTPHTHTPYTHTHTTHTHTHTYTHTHTHTRRINVLSGPPPMTGGSEERGRKKGESEGERGIERDGEIERLYGG